MTRIKKVIHDKLITDMEALKYYNDKTCFAQVEKIYTDFPSGTPFCQVCATEPSVEVDGLDFDNRSYGFAMISSDFISKDATQSQIDLQLDRMSDIEDSMLNYIEALPNNLAGLIAGVRPYKVNITSSQYQFDNAENGMRVYLIIEIAVVLSISVKEIA